MLHQVQVWGRLHMGTTAGWLKRAENLLVPCHARERRVTHSDDTWTVRAEIEIYLKQSLITLESLFHSVPRSNSNSNSN